MIPQRPFSTRIEQFEQSIRSINRRLDQIALIRLFVFSALFALEIWSWSWGGAWWMLVLFLGGLSFGWVLKWNQKVKQQLRYEQLLKQINEEELARLDLQLAGFDEGARFSDPAHPYTSDLDIFGRHSVFQWINHAGTEFGKRMLANWLSAAAPIAEIEARQSAIADLAPQIDWRQHLEALGRTQDQSELDFEELKAWLASPAVFSLSAVHRLAPYISVLVWAACIVMSILLPGLSWLPWIALLFSFFYIRNHRKQMAQAMKSGEKRRDLLKSWAKIIQHIETLPSKDAWLKGRQARLQGDKVAASKSIARLGSIVANLEFKDSGLPYFVVNAIFQWDIIWMLALEKWRRENAGRVLSWFEVIGEMEALASFAAIPVAQPDWARPVLLEADWQLEGEALGHPLIPTAQRIANPVGMVGKGQVWLITGSNMSGKSTYLRTVGMNVVLALAGAHVCAKSLRLSAMQVLTSMRSADNLEESTSSFYAELKRIKMVIEEVQRHPRTFFLLDEVLKGTNSLDRQAGARALVTQLHKYGGSGFVSTHDIELVDLEQELPGKVHNKSFNCEVSAEGSLKFDYTLTQGKCLSMNATALMRAMGIEM